MANKKTSLNIDADLYRAIQKIADEEHRNFSQQTTKIFEEWLKSRQLIERGLEQPQK
jgi:hypothetical protein